jgi:hypothetical protein
MPGTFLKDAFGISQAEKPWKVRLLFSKEVATYIKENGCGIRASNCASGRMGGLEIRLETSGRKELTRWILSWMPFVKVLAPRELRERITGRLRQGVGRQQLSGPRMTFSASTRLAIPHSPAAPPAVTIDHLVYIL